MDTINIETKPKRGRKSKKDLLLALNNTNMAIHITEIQGKEQELEINKPFFLNETHNAKEEKETEYATNKEDLKETQETYNGKEEEHLVFTSNKGENTESLAKSFSKKRGRKPKGGKIIQQSNMNTNNKNVKPNIILHLKCSLKDLNNNTSNNVESYNFFNNKNDMPYELINKPVNIEVNDNDNTDVSEYNDVEENNTKEIWQKIKQLEHCLHINNISDKKSACFWCTYDFDNPPIYIPKYYIKNSYHVYGCFCSPECGVAHLMEENIDSSTKFERYHLMNHLYGKVCNYVKNIKPAPNPYYMLDKYYGNLTIQEYRSLFKNERLFLIVDKPLTRVLPELHEDNDDFILNNKIIPSNNYQIKKKIEKKPQTKTNILNEKFGIV